MAKKISVKRFTGVYFSESTVRKWRERPDRCYWVAFKDKKTNKLHWERCGWASAGWTPEAAQRKRYELLEEDQMGKYKPRQERKADQFTFGEFMEKHYLPWADENKRRARDDRSLYKNWLKTPFSERPLKDIAPLDLERLKKEMRQEGKAEATVKHALCLIRQAFNKAVLWRLWKGDNPCKGVTFPAPNNGRRRFLSKEETDQLLDALRKRSTQLSQIATISLYGGLRLQEVLNLIWSNVDMKNGTLYVLDTKNKESRTAFITDPILKVIEELPGGNPDEPLFKTKQGRPIQWLSKTFRAVVEALKFNNGIDDPRERVYFHTMRHTYASWAVMDGVPLYVVGKSIGHKTLIMTQRYAHLAPDSYRKAFEAVAKHQTAPGNVIEATLLK
jgi:integrase